MNLSLARTVAQKLLSTTSKQIHPWLKRRVLAVTSHLNDKAQKGIIDETAKNDFSPSTMYEDYAINTHLFHWEIQSQDREASSKIQRYIHHKDPGTVFLCLSGNTRETVPTRRRTHSLEMLIMSAMKERDRSALYGSFIMRFRRKCFRRQIRELQFDKRKPVGQVFLS